VGDVIEVEIADDLMDTLVEFGLAAADPGQFQRVADNVAVGAGMGADPNVVEHRKVGNSATFWKVRPEPISAIRCGGGQDALASMRMSPALGW